MNDVIVAWGTSDINAKCNEDYQRNINKITSKLEKDNKNILAMRFVASNNPWHPRNWEGNFDLELYEWKR